MEIIDVKKLAYLLFLLQPLVSSRMDGCKCTRQDEMNSCHCEGDMTQMSKHLHDGSLHKLSLERINSSLLHQHILDTYKENLIDITITSSEALDHIDNEILQNMVMLNCLRVTHTSLKRLPQLKGLGVLSTMQIIDFESNQIEHISQNTVNVRVAQLSLDYNRIKSINGWAFNGSEIEKLSLKGNQELSDLSEDAFNGVKSLRALDLSETSITFLPTLGLERLEVLRIKETYTLKIIPSVYFLRNLQFAVLTYSFHCCAFHNPEKHDPVKHQEYMKLKNDLCKNNVIRMERDLTDQTFGDIIENNNASLFDVLNYDGSFEISEDLMNKGFFLGNNLEGNDGGMFHETSTDISKIKMHAVCGNLTGKFVTCLPLADPLNPCEDMMSWRWLRISVWFVLSTAVFGNIAVLVVLSLTRSEKSVPRFLMCNLAFADLLMAIYLLMLAIMDVISSETYFNYAYDWQRGMGCKIAGFITVFASQLSLFTLSLLTIERWFAIRHALYLNMLDFRLTVNVMIFGWLYSIIMAILPLIGVSNFSSTSICLPMDTHDVISQIYLITVILIAGCAFLLMSICYTQIYLSLSEETRHSLGEGSVARKMTILVGTNFVCWAPVAFFSLTALAGYPLISVSQSKILLVFIYPVNSCANPYLYAILTKQFRKDFMTLFSRYFNCKNNFHSKIGYSRPTSNDVPGHITTAETLL